MSRYAQIAVPAPLSQPLTYLVPGPLAGRIAVGMRCRVPLGHRQVTGYCTDLLARPPEDCPTKEFKEVLAILDEEPLFPPSLLGFFQWLADYYCHPIGEVIREALPGGLERVRVKRVAGVRLLLSPGADPPASLKPSAQRTIEILRELAADQRPVARPELCRRYPSARRALPALAEAGLVTIEEVEIQRDPFDLTPHKEEIPPALTDEQQQVLTQISTALRQGGFAPFLLHGVTGSGKTEVYLRAAAQVVAQGGGVLVLVPEIALAGQVEAHFHSRFPGRVALLHSGLPPGERYDQWRLVAAGQRPIVIGARSALFAPLANLRLIIVDEEHDPAYKQEDGLRYHARDAALVRGSREGAVVLLGTATPSLASFRNAERGKYRLLVMRHRIEDRPLPEVEIVDMRQELRSANGDPPLFSHRLQDAIAATLKRNEQILLFLNRRGFANFMVCRDCGTVVSCRHCQVSLTLHKGAGRLICHYCGYFLPAATLCPACNGTGLAAVGFGTERLEEELRHRFPTAAIGRLDRDTSRDRRKFHTLLQRVREGEIDILVGTQMITKGHHFPGVTLVGVVWADAGLGLPDFRAGERTFQLLAQVMGRAGRGAQPGRVVVQTIRPDHYALECARRHDYNGFYSQEAAFRKALGYPPFARMACLAFEGVDEGATAGAAREVCAKLQGLDGVRVLGPAPAPLARLRSRYRWQLVVQAGTVAALHRACRLVQHRPPAACRSRRVRLAVDIDPENLL